MKNIVLTGFMGTGKSSVGRRLAEELSLRFVDTDDLIEERAGLSISEIFKRFGERRFRSLEKEVIKWLSSRCNLVIATGGGAVMDEENLLNLKRNGVIICLMASPEVILARVGNRDERPLLPENGRKEAILKLLKEREPFYSKAGHTIDTTDKKVEDVVEEVRTFLQNISMNEQVNVNLGERSYSIYIGRDTLSSVGELMKAHGFIGKVACITNPVVGRLYGDRVVSSLKGAGFEAYRIGIPDGEEYKTLEWTSRIYDELITQRMERSHPLIALGGGVIGDITGFVAATYLRGVPYVQVPTTLLAQVDSSVGGKTAVNHPMGKNLIGAFYQPSLVLIDVDMLKTLEPREIKAGLAEVVKYGVIRDKELFSFLGLNSGDILNLGDSIIHVVRRSCEIKARVVEEDEREKGVRAVLNFGHTFGHAIEVLTGYNMLRHGEAVAMGMVMAVRLSAELGFCSRETEEAIKALITEIGLPTSPPPGIRAERFIEAMERDKKVKDGRIRLVLVKEIGKVVVEEVGKEEILKVFTTP
ncbi:MAG: 3-dehydroquinate synthase [Deltaproteobacteria bacterium]|nr:3-dehydroquinate synthase [Deltaproteobacteria bacterium]